MNLSYKGLLALLLLALFGCEQSAHRALGSLEWDRVNGRAIASEAITELYVKQGDKVTRGQPLLQLDPGLQQARVAQTQATIEQFKWRLSQLQAGYRVEQVAAAQAEYNAAVSTRRNRQLELERLKVLVLNQLTSQRNVDLARTSFDQADGAEQAAQQRLAELKHGYRTEEIEQAEAALAAQQAVLAYRQQRLDRYTVVAERDGVLESFPFKLGDKPPAGAVVTTVLSGAQPWARVYLPETWMSQVQTGTVVDVYVDGIDAPMQGRIRHIESRSSFTPYYALAEEDRKRLSYVTEIDLPGDAALTLPVGIPVQVALRVGQ